MKNSNSIVDEVPGTVVDSQLPVQKDIEKWLTRDLQACISFLNAILQDTELRAYMAAWFEGRIQNYKNKPEPVDPAQTKIPGT